LREDKQQASARARVWRAARKASKANKAAQARDTLFGPHGLAAIWRLFWWIAGQLSTHVIIPPNQWHDVTLWRG
jgi:hypothetical protein